MDKVTHTLTVIFTKQMFELSERDYGPLTARDQKMILHVVSTVISTMREPVMTEIMERLETETSNPLVNKIVEYIRQHQEEDPSNG